MLIALDGPEKAGKTSVSKVLESQFGFRVRHWGLPPDPPDPLHQIYLPALVEDCLSGDDVVWDRGWASEAVYSRLMDRGAPHTQDGWLLEWLYGRAFQTLGVRVMLLGPDWDDLESMRSKDDLPVHPMHERGAFESYADEFGWTVVENKGLQKSAEEVAEEILVGCCGRPVSYVSPPAWCGPSDANVVFVGEARNSGSTAVGAWLPFTTRYTTMLGRALGRTALDAAWTNAADGPPLGGADLVVVCGFEAFKFTKDRVGPDTRIHLIPHPAWLYRWGATRSMVESQERALRDTVGASVRGANHRPKKEEAKANA